MGAPQCGLCGAFIPRPPTDGSGWRCSNCHTEFDLPRATVEPCEACDGSGVIWRPPSDQTLAPDTGSET